MASSEASERGPTRGRINANAAHSMAASATTSGTMYAGSASVTASMTPSMQALRQNTKNLQLRKLGKSRKEVDKKQKRLAELARQLNDGDMHGVSGLNFTEKFNDRWMHFKDPVLEREFWEEWWKPVSWWWKVILGMYSVGLLALTANDITGPNEDIWKTRATGRWLGLVFMAVFGLCSRWIDALKRRQWMWFITVYWFIVGAILTDDERLIKGMRKFYAAGGILRDIAEFYNIEEVKDRAFCRSMMPFVVAQLSLWATSLRFTFRQSFFLWVITAMVYVVSAIYCELTSFSDTYSIGMEMSLLTWVGMTLLWATRRNETLTRYCFIRHVYDVKNKTQQEIQAAGRRQSMALAQDRMDRISSARKSVLENVTGSQAPTNSSNFGNKASVKFAEPEHENKASVHFGAVDTEDGTEEINSQPTHRGSDFNNRVSKRDSMKSTASYKSDFGDEGGFSLWIRLKDSMMMHHEIVMYSTHVDFVRNEFYDSDAENSFRTGTWMAVKVWLNRTGWVVFTVFFFLAMSDAVRTDADGNPVIAFVIVRIAIRSPVYVCMLVYRFGVRKIEAIEKKRKALFWFMQTYFACIIFHNDEIIATMISRPDLTTDCYGMLPFLTAQMAWMMVALRPPMRQVGWILVTVAITYFISGYIFQISTWTSGMDGTVYEMMCMLAAVITFTLSAARGEMLARNHFMIEFLKQEALEGKYGTELAVEARKERKQELLEAKERRASIRSENEQRRLSALPAASADTDGGRRGSRRNTLEEAEEAIIASMQVEASMLLKAVGEEPDDTKRKNQGRELGTLCVFGIVLCIFMFLVQQGYLQDAALGAAELGPVGHVIFIFFYIFVAMPFGWGFSLVIIAGGYCFGWLGLISAESGTLIGSLASYMVSKKLLTHWVKQKMKGFKPKTQKVLFSIEMVILSGKGGVGMQIGLRVNPVLPFGWTNAILGMWEVPLPNFIVSTMLGTQMDIMLKTSLGIMAKTVGEFATSTPEQQAMMETQLIIQIVIFVIFVIVGILYARWTFKNVMPEDMPEEIRNASDSAELGDDDELAMLEEEWEDSDQENGDGNGQDTFDVDVHDEGNIDVKEEMVDNADKDEMVENAGTHKPLEAPEVISHQVAFQVAREPVTDFNGDWNGESLEDILDNGKLTDVVDNFVAKGQWSTAARKRLWRHENARGNPSPESKTTETSADSITSTVESPQGSV